MDKGDMFNKIFGPSAERFGQMLGDMTDAKTGTNQQNQQSGSSAFNHAYSENPGGTPAPVTFDQREADLRHREIDLWKNMQMQDFVSTAKMKLESVFMQERIKYMFVGAVVLMSLYGISKLFNHGKK